MSRYYVEGTFEGYIEADSADEAEANFHESDIEDIHVLTVYEDEKMWARALLGRIHQNG